MTAGAPILTAAEMRAAERASGVPLAELMERAGRAVAEQARRFAAGRPVLVLCGPGNNGGDGWVAARWLAEWGGDVAVASSGEPGTDLAHAARAGWTGLVESLDEAAPRAVLVDALFGVGLTRTLEASIARPLHRLAEAAEFVLAVDLPSGLLSDDGHDGGGAAADVTLALGALKPAHVLMPGLERCGHVFLEPLGLEVASGASTLARPHLSAPARDAQKFTRGLVAVVGGGMSGAGRLAARAALSAGAGYVRLHTLDPVVAEPDALVVDQAADIAAALADDRIGAAVIGPGLGRDARARERLEAALASDRALVVDGDALSLLGNSAADRLCDRHAPTVLTPHSGEFERMMPGGGDKIAATRALAAATGAVVVHKGPDTVIAAPDGRVWVSVAGPSWLATAGSGDVLAGTVAARLAVTGEPFDAAAQAVWLHARAARLAGPAFHADKLIGYLPRAIAECL